MDVLVCPNCGSNSLREDGRYFVCEYCGTKVISEVSRAGFAPAAKLDNSEDIAGMLKRADIYWRHKKKGQAVALYRKILELDANCEIAIERSR